MAMTLCSIFTVNNNNNKKCDLSGSRSYDHSARELHCNVGDNSQGQ
jgi:hypothetical protein